MDCSGGSSEVQVWVFVENIVVVEARGVFGEGTLVLIQSLAVVGRVLDEAGAILAAYMIGAQGALVLEARWGWMVAVLVSHKGIYIQRENDHI